jgi:hypothetical protein
VFIVLLIIGLGVYGYFNSIYDNDSNLSTEVLSAEQDELEVEEKLPVRFISPDLEVDAEFEYLGLKDNGEVEVPESFEKVGWYMYGSLPGNQGPAIVIGHVDSKEGPAVFWSLGDLERGDVVTIVNAAGEQIQYRVRDSERYPQNKFPTDKVYGNTDTPELRIITCTGEYNSETKRYSHNLIVYADMIEN